MTDAAEHVPQAPRAGHEELVARAVSAAAERLAGESEAVADRLAARIHPELEGFPRHAAVTRSTVRAIEALVASFAGLVGRGDRPAVAPLPPAAVDYVHDHVRHGIDLSVVLRAYRLGHEELWGHWAALLDEAAPDAEVRLRARDRTSAALFGYMDDVSRRVIDEYRSERERWARSAAARRADVARTILDGEPVDVEAASRTLGVDLAQTHVGAVLWAADPAGQDAAVASAERLERTARDLAEAAGAGRPLTIAAGRRTLWAWFPARDGRPPALGGAASEGVGVALGEPAAGPGGFRRTHAEALAARRVARRSAASGPVRWGAVAVAGLLTGDAELARVHADRELGGLGADDEQAALLRATLLAHLDAARATSRTAAALGVHANTVGNRLRRCGELLGRDLDARPLELHAALLIRATLDEPA